MARKEKHDEDDGSETVGSDIEQMIAMLERAEVDYDKQNSDEEDDDESSIVIEDILRMNFDADGNLTGVEKA